ncbi:fumarylacetoacetase [Pseudoruegeria sp. SK021]|uniref:fumarylacetoacetase n=1 Tax=Pseudoruegeria sp. SK021 TaxID=1933035 RepID=UPI000A237D4E|nr:fumarylacetoacetase [Pseudoruegeria sp. SK021]OSP54565.1 fumarylacetoacetase [Pseudoruegeria sp. SK021]
MTDLLISWIDSANSDATDFPLNNLPYGVFLAEDGSGHCGVAIGAHILDLHAVEAAGQIDFSGTLCQGDWSPFMARGTSEWARLRSWLQSTLAKGASEQPLLEPHLVSLGQAQMLMPFRVSEYTDFYASRHHATNVGMILRGADGSLPANWLHIPIGYNGRASSVVVSGTDVRRPSGQLKAMDETAPRLGASQRFDFELELGAVVGQASQGPINVGQAFENIFGYVLLNDWSARDIQAWEYLPLGPFQSKATATTISPWIVTTAALEPFRTNTPERDVPLLDYLTELGPMLFDIDLNVAIKPENGPETTISRTNYASMYYSAAQQLAHHTSSGCPMRVGDLLGSGTISGPEKTARGCMLEITWGGQQPVELSSGAMRTFLEDGDTVILRGGSVAKDYRVGFGACVGKVVPNGTM